MSKQQNRQVHLLGRRGVAARRPRLRSVLCLVTAFVLVFSCWPVLPGLADTEKAASLDGGYPSSAVAAESPSFVPGANPNASVEEVVGSVNKTDSEAKPGGDAPSTSDSEKRDQSEEQGAPPASSEETNNSATDTQAADELALRSSDDSGLSVVYVSSLGSDVLGNGSVSLPFASITKAVQRAANTAEIVVVSNLVSLLAVQVGDKDIVVRGQRGVGGIPPVVTSTLALNLFNVSSGSLTIQDLTVDGGLSLLDHRAVEVSGEGGSLTLGNGATIRDWFSTGSRGAVRLQAKNASFTMKNGSLITNCSLVGAGSFAGGAAVSIGASRDPGSVPSSSYRASFSMENGSSITKCSTQITANASYSGGGAVRAVDTNVTIAQGASIRDSKLEYRSTLGVLFDATATRQGGGALFAYNCKVTMAGTIDNCSMNSADNKGTGDFYAGGGGLFVYNSGCTPGIGLDCRTSVSGTISNCSAIAGGGAYYWSESDGYDQGDNLWVGPSGPRTSADEVIASVYDAFIVSGTIENCSTTDNNNKRKATLTSYVDYEHYGIGGGAVSGAYTGLIVLDDSARISGCTTGSEGGAVSSWGTSVFCLDRTDNNSGGPVVESCTSGGIAGGLSMGAASHIENVTVKNCSADSLGGGLYIYSGSTTLYDCEITACSAGTYGGGIMQHVVHDLFMYGGTVSGNSAGSGGGGVALVGHSGGTLTAPRGLSFNYPTTLNGGYTNPVYYKSAILANKIVAPCVVANNSQETPGKTSNLWTPSSSPVTRISASGAFLSGSKVGVTVSDGSTSYNKTGTQFGNASQPNLSLGPFSCDVDTTLAPAYSGSNLTWAQGFTVSYAANAPAGMTASGSTPFDGVAGIPHAYLRVGGAAPVLAAGTLAVNGYLFRGWATSATATTASHQPGASLSYRTTLDPDGDGRVMLYAVWEKIDYVCQIIRDANGDGVPDSFYKAYSTLYGAFREVKTNDRIEMLKNAPLVDFANEIAGYPSNGVVVLSASVTGATLATAPVSQSVSGAKSWQGAAVSGTPKALITRTAKGAVAASFSVAGGLSFSNVILDGGCTPLQAQTGLGIKSSSALVSATGVGATVVLGSGSTVQNAWNAIGSGGGLFVGAGATATIGEGASLIGCTARDGGGIACSSDTAATPSRLVIAGGTIASSVASRFGGGVFVGARSTASLGGAAKVQSNRADCSGGGLYVDASGTLAVTGGMVSNNASTAIDQVSAVGCAFVGGIGHGMFTGGSALITLSGNAVVSGNFGRPAGSPAYIDPGPSDVQVEYAGNAYSLGVAAAGLGSGASVGVTSANVALLTSGAQFTAVAGGNASAAAYLDSFFNNSADLHGGAGVGAAVCWRSQRVNASFVKVGADQSTGTAVALGGARFNVYRYVGTLDLCTITINAGGIDLAGLASTQWAPVTGPNGEEGNAGGVSNTPYAFISSDGTSGVARGTVQLTGLAPGVWYMLVEAGAPAGYQRPGGQWAFKVVESPTTSGKYSIDSKTMLARKGVDGLLPPAFATSITLSQGKQAGLYLPNTPIFSLPYAGVDVPWLLGVMATGVLLVIAALALYTRRTSVR